jgi:hypothetical protein
MSAAPAPASYNPTQTTPFEVIIELLNRETDGSGRHFGFFKLTTIPFPEGHKKSGNYRVHIALDVSTSMREENRLGLAKDTTAKMVEFLASASKENPELNFWFTLTTFSTDARVVINNSKVSEDTVRLITSAVQMIRPENSTNFEASFNLDRKIMEQQAAADQEAGNTVTTLHIVMTDGEVTAGNNNEDELKGMLCNNVEHVFIGYGAGHKAACLMNLASVNEKSSYLFLDHPTKMGAMFAQIFCPHLFTSISDVEIELTGAKFLDIESGNEVETQFVKRIAADTTKTFHLMTDPRVDAVHYADGDEDRHRVKEIYVRMQFRSFDNADLDEPPNFPFCKPYSVISATTHSLDVQKERKRWAVLVLMKDAKELKNREQAHQQHQIQTRSWFDASMFKEERDALIHRATELKDEIKEFAEQNGIADDEMLKDLTTDLVICICAIPSHEHGLMYINSRFRSCTDETPTAVSDLTPLDDHVQDFLNSSGYNCGDDRLYSCGGDNDDALYRRRSSGAANAAYDNMARVMSQPSQPSQQPLSQEPPIQRRNSSYRQQQQQQQQPPFLSDDVNDNYHHHHNDDDSFSNSSHVVITNDNYDVEPCSDDVPTPRR